jgi:hypothetical protein
MSIFTVRAKGLPNAPLPAGRFTTDASVRMKNRESTVSGAVADDGLMVESSDGNDFILLESGTGSGASYLQLEG